MTLSRHDKFAFVPKRCDKCNRLFIFEPYNTWHKWIWCPGCSSIEMIECKECEEKKIRDKWKKNPLWGTKTEQTFFDEFVEKENTNEKETVQKS